MDNKNIEKSNKKGDFKIIMIATIIVIAIVVIAVLINSFGKKEKTKEDNNEDNKVEKNEVIKKGSSEEDIKLSYGMSKEDAINIVKEIYNGDVFEFVCDINSDSKYIVTVKNTLSNSVTKYLVDPESKDNSFYEINE